jgi:hypothetical protein
VPACVCLACRRLWDRPEHLQQLLDAARDRMLAWVQGQQQQQQGHAWGCCSLGELLQGFFASYQDLFSDWVLGRRRWVQGRQADGNTGKLCCSLLPEGGQLGVGGMSLSTASSPGLLRGIELCALLFLLLLLRVQGGVCGPVGWPADLPACST